MKEIREMVIDWKEPIRQDIVSKNDLSRLENLRLAVVGHVEWVNFLSVDKLPSCGQISHGKSYLKLPSGGGAVSAIQMQKLTNKQVHFFTSLGKDHLGKLSKKLLEEYGLKVHVAWRDRPTREGISFLDKSGERSITVIGKRLEPKGKDNLPWDEIASFDGVFVSATDAMGLKLCRNSKILVATPRVGKDTFSSINFKLDALVGSYFDKEERMISDYLTDTSKLKILTAGKLGSVALPGGTFATKDIGRDLVDSYGCGDSFAAGVTAGLACNLDIKKAINIGSYCGYKCAMHKGPYGD